MLFCVCRPSVFLTRRRCQRCLRKPWTTREWGWRKSTGCCFTRWGGGAGRTDSRVSLVVFCLCLAVFVAWVHTRADPRYLQICSSAELSPSRGLHVPLLVEHLVYVHVETERTTTKRWSPHQPTGNPLTVREVECSSHDVAVFPLFLTFLPTAIRQTFASWKPWPRGWAYPWKR